MPLYLYRCECGYELNISHSITEDPELKCSQCDGIMRRGISTPTVNFKGSGFYSTDKTQGGGVSRG